MGWFEHKHYWREKTGLNKVFDPATNNPTSALIVEDCRCGAVRTIEFAPGKAPIVRMAEIDPR